MKRGRDDDTDEPQGAVFETAENTVDDEGDLFYGLESESTIDARPGASGNLQPPLKQVGTGMYPAPQMTPTGSLLNGLLLGLKRKQLKSIRPVNESVEEGFAAVVEQDLPQRLLIESSKERVEENDSRHDSDTGGIPLLFNPCSSLSTEQGQNAHSLRSCLLKVLLIPRYRTTMHRTLRMTSDLVNIAQLAQPDHHQGIFLTRPQESLLQFLRAIVDFSFQCSDVSLKLLVRRHSLTELQLPPVSVSDAVEGVAYHPLSLQLVIDSSLTDLTEYCLVTQQQQHDRSVAERLQWILDICNSNTATATFAVLYLQRVRDSITKTKSSSGVIQSFKLQLLDSLLSEISSTLQLKTSGEAVQGESLFGFPVTHLSPVDLLHDKSNDFERQNIEEKKLKMQRLLIRLFEATPMRPPVFEKTDQVIDGTPPFALFSKWKKEEVSKLFSDQEEEGLMMESSTFTQIFNDEENHAESFGVEGRGSSETSMYLQMKMLRPMTFFCATHTAFWYRVLDALVLSPASGRKGLQSTILQLLVVRFEDPHLKSESWKSLKRFLDSLNAVDIHEKLTWRREYISTLCNTLSENQENLFKSIRTATDVAVYNLMQWISARLLTYLCIKALTGATGLEVAGPENARICQRIILHVGTALLLSVSGSDLRTDTAGQPHFLHFRYFAFEQWMSLLGQIHRYFCKLPIGPDASEDGGGRNVDQGAGQAKEADDPDGTLVDHISAEKREEVEKVLVGVLLATLSVLLSHTIKRPHSAQPFRRSSSLTMLIDFLKVLSECSFVSVDRAEDNSSKRRTKYSFGSLSETVFLDHFLVGLLGTFLQPYDREFVKRLLPSFCQTESPHFVQIVFGQLDSEMANGEARCKSAQLALAVKKLFSGMRRQLVKDQQDQLKRYLGNH